MPAGTPRGGIEWRILKSILLIGALPLIVAVVGLLIAARGQTSAVQENLSIAADTTSYGLRNAAAIRLEALDRLAQNPRVVGALIPSGPDKKPTILSSRVALYDLRDFLGRRTASDASDEDASEYALYDAKGQFVDATDAESGAQHPAHPDWVLRVPAPRFVELEFVPDQNKYLAQAVAPVFSPSQSERIGFIAETFDITPLLMFGLGYDPRRDSSPPVGDLYQLLSPNSEGETVAWRIERTADADAPIFVSETLHKDFGDFMLHPARGASGTAVVSQLLADRPGRRSFVAYNRIFDGYPLFVLVSRPASEVYEPIFLWSVLAISACVLSIGFFYLNAYRNVHNNIVRPVLLLNEGAQIIERGDLELKLKIGTGDEIEELAMSFNKMALALKRNIRQLEESEEKYRGLVDSMRDGIFQADLDGVIGFVNPAAAEILGFDTQDSAIGTNLRDLFRDADEVGSFFAELKEKGFVERSRIWMHRSNERATCVELSGNLLHDEDRTPNGIEGIFRDVTKNIRLERDARDRAERLSVINQIANVINSSLEAGRLYESLVVEVKKLVEFDYAELGLLGEDGDRFVAQPLWPEHSAPARAFTVSDDDGVASRVLRTGECLIVGNLGAPDCAVRSHFPPGHRSCLGVPLYATGRIIGTLSLSAQRAEAFTQHDVDVLQQMAPHVAVAIRNAQLLENLQQSLEEVTLAREKLHEANEELKTLDEMKTNLLSNVSHELRTPLVSVMGYTDMIINGKAGPVNAEQKEYLGISLRNIEKLVTLIENLLDFSRLHRGAETIVFDEFDLRDCAKASVQVIQPVADSRGIVLELKAPNDPVLVEGDKSKLGQVFTNLLSNAVKFNHPNGSIVVEFTLKDDCVHVAVRDTGIGIPQEALDKIFTRFYQYDSSSTRKYGGTGIGLSIAQDIARLHGTRITASSELGKGSTFRFVLPLAGARRGEKRSAGVEPDAPGTRLLVELVTQDRALSYQVRTLLQSEGMDVIHALDAQHAINLAQRHSPDCLLVDCAAEEGIASLPLLDSLLADKSSGDIPIIMMTGDEALYSKYRSLVAARVKRSFRKSSLLGGIQYAIGQSLSTGEPLGHKVLCVDDDGEVLRFIERCLESEGYDVVTCTSGEQALRLALTREFGVVLMDIAMPGIDGWEACRRLKRDHALAGIKVFMVTAKPVDSSSARYRDYGADGYLLKPFHAEDLLELVQSVATPRMVREV